MLTPYQGKEKVGFPVNQLFYWRNNLYVLFTKYVKLEFKIDNLHSE